jgi:hypothetical protein
MLTRDDILFILEHLSRETVVPESAEFPYRVTRRGQGYSKDSKSSIILRIIDRWSVL